MIQSQDFQHLRRKSRSWHHIAAVVVVVATLVLVVCMLLTGCAGMADRIAGGAQYAHDATTQPAVRGVASMIGVEPILAAATAFFGTVSVVAAAWGNWQRNRKNEAQAETVATKEHTGRIVASVEAVKADIPAASKEIMHEVQGESTTAFVHEIRDEPVAAKAARRAAAAKKT